jgi:hypothetical protein
VGTTAIYNTESGESGVQVISTPRPQSWDFSLAMQSAIKTEYEATESFPFDSAIHTIL